MKSRTKLLLASVLFIYLVLEGLCFGCLWLLARTRNIRYDPRPTVLSAEQRSILTEFLKRSSPTGIDDTLGWINPPSHTNSVGIRDDHEYATVPQPGTLRISAFGDSFTYGGDVSLGANWTKQITAIDPSIEVLNYGVGGYGLDQAYLRYLKIGTDYHPNIVLIGYMSQNVDRQVNVLPAFYTNMFHNLVFTKPRFRVEDDQLVLLPNPLSTFSDYENFLKNDATVLPELGKNDYWYQINYSRGPLDFLPSVRLGKVFFGQVNQRVINPIFNLDGQYNTKSEAYRITVKILDAFYQKALDNGALPIILVFPDRNDQTRSRQGEIRRYAALLEHFQSKGYRHIDILNALDSYNSRYSVADLTVAWGHYSPIGNTIIANYILAQLKSLDLVDPSKVSQAVQQERQRLAQVH